MAQTKKTTTRDSTSKAGSKKPKAKTPVKKSVKPKINTKKVAQKPEIIDQKAIEELNKAIEISMKEAQDAVIQAVHNTAQQSDYSE